jgi:hypothetical protein
VASLTAIHVVSCRVSGLWSAHVDERRRLGVDTVNVACILPGDYLTE